MKPVAQNQVEPAASSTPSEVSNRESETPVPAKRILKIASCPSLSGRSTLTYHLGCSANTEEPAVPDLYFRVFENSGGGLFSNEWVSLEVIQQVFAKVPTAIGITAHLLGSLFVGKSVNTPSFLFAVLKSEGLVVAVKEKKGCYERTDPSGFMAEVTALMASGVDLAVDEPAKAKAKATVGSTTGNGTPEAPKKAGKKNRQGGHR